MTDDNTTEVETEDITSDVDDVSTSSPDTTDDLSDGGTTPNESDNDNGTNNSDLSGEKSLADDNDDVADADAIQTEEDELADGESQEEEAAATAIAEEAKKNDIDPAKVDNYAKEKFLEFKVAQGKKLLAKANKPGTQLNVLSKLIKNMTPEGRKAYVENKTGFISTTLKFLTPDAVKGSIDVARWFVRGFTPNKTSVKFLGMWSPDYVMELGSLGVLSFEEDLARRMDENPHVVAKVMKTGVNVLSLLFKNLAILNQPVAWFEKITGGAAKIMPLVRAQVKAEAARLEAEEVKAKLAKNTEKLPTQNPVVAEEVAAHDGIANASNPPSGIEPIQNDIPVSAAPNTNEAFEAEATDKAA